MEGGRKREKRRSEGRKEREKEEVEKEKRPEITGHSSPLSDLEQLLF